MIDNSPPHDSPAPPKKKAPLRLLGAAALLAVASAAFGIPALATGTGSLRAPTKEPDLLSLYNKDRMSSRLPRLAINTDLEMLAEKHARKMAAQGRVFFNETPVTELPPSSTIAEWDGYASTVGHFHQVTLATDPVREVLLGDFEDIGIGVARDRSGTVYVAVLMRRPESG
jgi:uncharacterized protein YkwD